MTAKQELQQLLLIDPKVAGFWDEANTSRERRLPFTGNPDLPPNCDNCKCQHGISCALGLQVEVGEPEIATKFCFVLC